MQDLELVVAGHPSKQKVAVAHCGTDKILPQRPREMQGLLGQFGAEAGGFLKGLQKLATVTSGFGSGTRLQP